MAQQGKIFSGDLYGRMYGSDDGLVLMGNVTELSTKSETENKELIGTGKHNFGQAISAFSIPKPTEISIKFNSFDRDAIARALMGEAVVINQSVQAINSTGKVSKTGWIKLSHQNINPTGFAVRNKSSSEVDAKHYELNPVMGMLRFLPTATMLTEGDNFTYTGNTLASNGFSVDANSKQSFELELYLDAKELISQNNVMLHIPHVVISSDGGINWLSTDWIENGLSGKVIKDEGMPTMRFMEFQV